ncbi:MAG TPA: ferredoxin [Candidatus Limnocylindrales bacterium]|nr:ferredoxin [Candidatus Limnocylindrales bacterium]
MSIDVTVDPDLCIGSGDCVRILPTGFRIDEDRNVSVPLTGAGDQDPERLKLAAFTCPTQSIRLVAEDGTVIHESN